MNDLNTNLDCVVNLTTWKQRINDSDTFRSIYSLIRQKTKYHFKVFLTLSKEEFPLMNNELPDVLYELYKQKFIDIIWTENNYKALKKLYPIIHLYNCPIMTTDDDIICDEKIVECFMDMHFKYPYDVLSEQGITVNGIDLPGGFRLFPKNSFLDIDPNYFKECFETLEDDFYIALLMKYKNTKIRYIHSGLIQQIQRKRYDKTALRNTYEFVNRNKYAFNLENALKRNRII